MANKTLTQGAGVAVTISGNNVVVGAAPVVLTASENIAAGALINVWDNAGVAEAQNANATDATKPADGFAVVAATTGQQVQVMLPGQVDTELTGLTPGALYFLDVNPGGVVATPPSTAGNLVQQVGKAISATSLIFNPHQGIQL
jgi:hypothetical protein